MADIEIKRQEFKEDRKKGMAAPVFTPAGQSTQRIIGATPSNDQAILLTSSDLYKNYKLRRVYYSAYSPIPHADTRLPSIIPPLVREHRLYQADWLLRFYNYTVEEITPASAPNLSMELDPKTSWALRNPDFFPVDINRASRDQLLRIPGIGVRTVDKILSIRRFHAIKFEDLKRLKVAMKRAKFFIIAANYFPPAHLKANTLFNNSNPAQQLAFDFL